jgi:2-deoxy-D-gluconate 3-dehydrogenase
MHMKLEDFSMDLFLLNGKNAIVTGGNKGLGMGYAVSLAKAGANILIPTLDPNVDEIKKLIEPTGQKLIVLIGDITKKEFRNEVIQTCMSQFGSIDILVNNAGLIIRKPLLEATEEEWYKVIEVNLNSVYLLSSEVAKVMINQNSGKIINIASLLSFRGGFFAPSYPASKHGVVGLTKAFANQLGKYNIQVNAIAPGYIADGNSKEIMNDEQINKQILSRIPMGRWGSTFDLMGMAVFLASNASNYITGSVFQVDGGWLST